MTNNTENLWATYVAQANARRDALERRLDRSLRLTKVAFVVASASAAAAVVIAALRAAGVIG